MITSHRFEVKFFFCAIYRMLFSEASPLSARPLPVFCVTVLIFTTLSLTFLILSYVKEPILSVIPPFPPLWNYLLAKSGCESYVLKVYLGVLYLPFGIIFSLIIKSYEPFFAVVVYFIYQAIILFRRIRLLSRLLNKVYDLCSSDLGVKEYVKRDYGHFVGPSCAKGLRSEETCVKISPTIKINCLSLSELVKANVAATRSLPFVTAKSLAWFRAPLKKKDNESRASSLSSLGKRKNSSELNNLFLHSASL